MLQEGLRREGLRCIADIRARYDGRRRNPFDEAECGHHYARAMASWAAVLELTGFRYSAVDGSIAFRPTRRVSSTFWSTGYAWGVLEQRPARTGVRVVLRVLGGCLLLRSLTLAGRGAAHSARTRRMRRGAEWRVTI
jgi:hypothetical protein